MLDAKNHAWAAENILYKVPYKPAMDGPSALICALPESRHAGRRPDQVRAAARRRPGAADYSRIVAEIKAAQ